MALFLRHRQAEGDVAGGLATYRDRLRAVGRVLGDPDPCGLTEADGLRYRELRLAMPGARRGTTISPRTCSAEMSAVVELQQWLRRRGWTDVATWADVRRPTGQHGREWYRTSEVGPFLRAAEQLDARWPGWAAMAYVAVSTVLRPGELCRLTIREVDLVYGTIRVAQGKSEAAETVVPIGSTKALELITAWVETRQLDGAATTDLVWPLGRRGRAARDEKPYRRRLRITARLAGVPDTVCPYGLRHTGITLLGQRASADDLRALARHADEGTTKRAYRHVLPGDRRRAASALGGIVDRLAAGKPRLRPVP